MKKTLLILTLTITNVSFATITNSKYEDRHQVSIEKAISNSCGQFRDLLQLESNAKIVVVDQGINDVKFQTVLTGLKRLGQNIFDLYTITVESNYSDSYDHDSKEWGTYSVDSVFCQMQ